jgi:hypothetical protein
MPRKQTALQKVKQRALVPDPEQVLSFPADETDLLLAEGCLNGFGSFKALADFCELEPKFVRERLLDPVRCAWISQYVDKMLPTRMGQVLGAVFTRAVSTGDPSAATMLLKQYKKWLGDDVKKSVHLNLEGKIDLTNLTDEQLKLYIAEQVKHNKDILDAEFEEKPPDA